MILAILLTSEKSIWYCVRGSIVFAPVCASLMSPQPAWRLSCNLTSTLSTCLVVDTHTPQFSLLSNCFFFLSKPSTETLLPLFAVWPQGKSSSSSPPAIHLPGQCLPSCAARPSPTLPRPELLIHPQLSLTWALFFSGLVQYTYLKF